ncbi:MAG: extracellular solute-binding protein [Spirochaetota bacterium]
MKRLFLLFLIACSAATLAYPRGEQEEGKVDKLVYISTPWGTPSQELLAGFESKTGIKVEVTTLDTKPLRDKVLAAAAGKVNPADVIFVGIDDIGAFASSGILIALDTNIPKEMFNSMYGMQFFQMDGKTWAVPLYQQMVMIDYDAAALAKIGVKAESIKTWDDFESVSAKLKRERISEYPVSFGIRSWSWYILALSMGSTLFDGKMEALFDKPDDPGYRAFVKLIDYYKKGLISPERVSSPNPHPAFWAGQSVFHQAWQGSLAVANDKEKSKVAPNADYLLLPDKHFTWSLPAGLGVSSYTKYSKASKKFIEFMITEEIQMYTYLTHGMFPALKSLFKRLGDEGKIQGYKTMAQQAEYLVTLPYNTPWYAEFNTEATNALVRAARGEQTVDQAIKALADFQRKVKKEYE